MKIYLIDLVSPLQPVQTLLRPTSDLYTSGTVGKLVTWLPLESIQENMPKIYRKAGYGKVRVIIDCSEVFIERSKSLNVQALTWSDYKSHNTIKFLIGISPTGYITFLSDCYGGCASDRLICNDSNSFDLLDPYDEVMADRGFQIQEELLLKFCTLSVPPGARLKSQMTTQEVKKTKEVANRIHVERAIDRIKAFRISKSILPITMLHHCDDIILTCAALCNLKSLLFNPRGAGIYGKLGQSKKTKAFIAEIIYSFDVLFWTCKEGLRKILLVDRQYI